MPKWGLSMKEGTVAEWQFAEGDTIARGDEVVFIETSKITGPLESTLEGVLQKIVAQPGAVLPVGGLLAVVTDGKADSADIDAFVADFQANFVPAAASENDAAAAAQVVEVEGRRISYVLTAPEECEGATPVLLVHGFGGDKSGWLFNSSELAQDRPVYAFDLPGHGESSKDVGEADLEMFASSVVGFLDALEIDAAHIVAHSMGGAIALSVTTKHPSRVASLALIGACGLGEGINRGFIDGYITAQRRKEIKPVLQELFPNPELVTRDMIDNVLKFKRLDGVPEALQKVADVFFPDGKQAIQFRDQLSGLEQRVLVIWGAEDTIVYPVDAEGLPDAVEVHVLDGVGHIPQMEAAPEVNRLLTAHLRAAEK